MTLYHLQAFLILSVGATLFPADYTLGSLNSVFETSLPSSTHQCSQADATCLKLVLTLHFQGPIFIQESICPVIYCCLTNDLKIWWLKNVLLFSELPGFLLVSVLAWGLPYDCSQVSAGRTRQPTSLTSVTSG